MKRLDESDSPYSGIGRESMSHAAIGADLLELKAEVVEAPKRTGFAEKPTASAIAAQHFANRMREEHQKAQRAQSPQIAVPQWVSILVDSLKTRFVTGPDGREWDEDEKFLYTKQVVMLNRDQCRAVYFRLRELYKWRPSVSEVKAVVVELTGINTDPIPGNVADSRRVIAAPTPDASQKQIEASTDETPAYNRAQSVIDALRKRDMPGWKPTTREVSRFGAKKELIP